MHHRWFPVVMALGLALPAVAVADVELPPDPAAPPAGDRAYEDETIEIIDGPPPEIELGFFSGTRSGPYPRLGVEADIIVGEFRSDFEFESRNGRGNEVRIDDDLPLDDDTLGAIELRAWIAITESWEITAGWFFVGAEDEGLMQRSVIHDGVTFEEGDDVEFEVEAQVAWVGLRFLAINVPDVKFGIPFGALWTQQRLKITNRTTGGQVGEGEIDQFSPYVGLYLDIHFGYGFGLETELRFFAWGDDDDRLFGYFDGRAQVYLTVMDHVRLFAGVRALATDYYKEDDNDRESTWHMTGGFAGVAIYF